MKKGLVISLVLISLILAASLLYAADDDCVYDERFDKDKDYIMNKGADCGLDYTYDCDDSDNDVFKDCGPNRLWDRIVSWLKGAGPSKPNNIISSNAVRNIIPGSEEALVHIGRVKSKTVASVKSAEEDCAVTICLDDELHEVYCPRDYDACCESYIECRVVECEKEEELCEEETATDDNYITDDEYEYLTQGELEYEDDGICTEEYHDCFDSGTEVICKGDFDACDASFTGCTCGTGDGMDNYEEQAVPDIDSSAPLDCGTGVFVCKRQVTTMSGDLADSTVTCKESFQRCSMMYGNCECGDSSLTDFPTEYTGDTDGEPLVAPTYMCDFEGKNIPCYMMPAADCREKKNSCDRGDGIWITCDGAFPYCNRTFDGHCLCGVENLGYGDMITDAD